MFDSFIKKVENFFYRKPRTYFERNPFRDWKIMLVSFFALAFIVIVADAYIFYRIDKGDLFAAPASVTSSITTIDRSSLQQENAFYDAENTAFQSINQATTSPVIDPSL